MSSEAVTARYTRIADEVSALSGGRTTVLPVSKTFPLSLIEELVRFGVSEFGESRVQEVEAKFPAGFPAGLRMIGHLQSNKAKRAVSLFSSIDSVDSHKLLEFVSRAAVEQNRTIGVLLEYNSSGEAAKHGCPDADAVVEMAEKAMNLPGIELRGLMTMGPLTDDELAIARSFAETRKLFERIAAAVDNKNWQTLSMGMSGDYRIAIREGSTLVRIGTAIFGGR